MNIYDFWLAEVKLLFAENQIKIPYTEDELQNYHLLAYQPEDVWAEYQRMNLTEVGE